MSILTLGRFIGQKNLDKASDEGAVHSLVKKAVVSARKLNICFDDNRRAYVPENLRGKGVGYGKHGK